MLDWPADISELNDQQLSKLLAWMEQIAFPTVADGQQQVTVELPAPRVVDISKEQ
jgi:hypothetical protein